MRKPKMQTKCHQIILFLVLLVPFATASPIIPYFYHVKVHLTEGEVLTGNTWGISWFGDSLFQEQEVRRVDIQSTRDTVIAAFHLIEKDGRKTFKASINDSQGHPHSLVLSSRHERYEDKSGLTYFWVIDKKEIPLTQISSIETVNVIGRGHAVDNPRPYQNVQEPFVVVEDCGRGCAVKLFSRDPAVTGDDLKRLWAEHLHCESVLSEAEQTEVKKQHQLELLTDPFCTD